MKEESLGSLVNRDVQRNSMEKAEGLYCTEMFTELNGESLGFVVHRNIQEIESSGSVVHKDVQ